MLLAAAAFAGACGGKPAPEAARARDHDPGPARARRRRRSMTAPTRIARSGSGWPERPPSASRAVAADLAAMINFDYDQAVVRPTDQATLDRKAAILGANPERQGPDQRPRRRARLGRIQPGPGQPARRCGQALPREQGRRRLAAWTSSPTARSVRSTRAATRRAYAQNRRDEFEVTAGGDNLAAPQ